MNNGIEHIMNDISHHGQNLLYSQNGPRNVNFGIESYEPNKRLNIPNPQGAVVLGDSNYIRYKTIKTHVNQLKSRAQKLYKSRMNKNIENGEH